MAWPGAWPPQGAKRAAEDDDADSKFLRFDDPGCGSKGYKGGKGFKGGKSFGGCGGFGGKGSFGGKGGAAPPRGPFFGGAAVPGLVPPPPELSAALGDIPRPPSYGAPNGGASGGGSEQVVTSEFDIPAHKVKDVLGVKGRNIKAIKMQSGVQKLAIMDRSEPAIVTVTGSAGAIEKAREMVLAICAGNQGVIGNVVETMEIGQKMVSKVIGPKGQVITQLKELSGAYLEVREPGGGHLPKIIMTGPPECVSKARELCMQFIAAQGSGGDGAAVLLGAQSAGSSAAAADPYSEYLAQARLQEGLIHAQLQEASLQATLQDGGLPGDGDALAGVQQALQAQLATQAAMMTAASGGGQSQDLAAILALLALAGQSQQPSPPPAPPAGIDLGQLLQLAAASSTAPAGGALGALAGAGSLGALLPGLGAGALTAGPASGQGCGLEAMPAPAPAPAEPQVTDQVQQLLNALRVQMEAHSGG